MNEEKIHSNVIAHPFSREIKEEIENGGKEDTKKKKKKKQN